MSKLIVTLHGFMKMSSVWRSNAIPTSMYRLLFGGVALRLVVLRLSLR
jgi:hypothetical protein